MTDLPQPDDQTFRLATGEEVDLFAPADEVRADEVRADEVRADEVRADDGLLAEATSAPVARPRPPRPTYRDRRTAGRLRARKVRRLVRHVEPWSVLKISLIFYFCLWVIFLTAGVLLWSLAVGSGTIDNLENFLEEILALESFEFNADQIFRASALGGLVLVVAGSGFTVLVAVLFNLISDVTGGVRFTVVEEETARPRPKRIRPRRSRGAGVTPPRPSSSSGAPVLQEGLEPPAVGLDEAPILPTAESPEGPRAEVATSQPDR